MAEPFPFELVSPAKQLVSGEALEVTIPGSEGYFQVLANHAPFLSTIKPGIIEVKMADDKLSRFVVFGGFADVSPAGCSVLAEQAVDAGELSGSDLDERIKSADEAIESAKGDAAKAKAVEFRDQLEGLKAAL